MFVRSLRAAAIGGFAASIFLASGTFENGGRAEAATLDNVTVDRSVRLLDGTVNVFPGSPAGFAVSTFGATMIDLAAPAGYSVSGSFDGTGGVIDFFDTGFPPSSIFAGAIQDVNYESGFLAILFEDTASSDLLVLEASNTGLPGTGVFISPVPNVAAVVYAATEDASPVPLPASGLLLFAAIGLAGIAGSRRRRI